VQYLTRRTAQVFPNRSGAESPMGSVSDSPGKGLRRTSLRHSPMREVVLR